MGLTEVIMVAVLVAAALAALLVVVMLRQLREQGAERLRANAADTEAADRLAKTQAEAETLMSTARQTLADASDREADLARRTADLERRTLEVDRLAIDAEAARGQADQLHTEHRRRRGELDALRQELDSRALAERDDLRSLRAGLERREQRLAEREDRIAAEAEALDARTLALDERRGQLDDASTEIETRRRSIAAELVRVAGLDADQARAELMARVEHEARLDAAALARDIERKATGTAEARARQIITTAVQRLAADQTSEAVVSTVDLPGDDMKGRIIGREGRNIRHFEQITGVNVMIDDTPGSVLLSCFDPVRRETARLTLEELVADGRIHPARIEELHEKSASRVAERCRRAAEDALAEMGISDLDPALVPILGSLLYRTSYGQNVLAHLVECGHLAAMMAAELGLDVATCRRAAFLHDIGKALTHEVEGSHALVGAELARRHGEHPDIVHAIEAHHNEVEPHSVEAILTQAADAISGSRPGARRESLEAYVQRLEKLEQIAGAHDGVDKVFAMQAGREVRVMVRPEQVDDLASHALARDIAHQIQTELTYPGQIRVTVVRESRATEVAH